MTSRATEIYITDDHNLAVLIFRLVVIVDHPALIMNASGASHGKPAKTRNDFDSDSEEGEA